jgi:hypothetical protein
MVAIPALHQGDGTQVALSRALRWMSFDDRAADRASVDVRLEHPFESLVVDPGTPIASARATCLLLPHPGFPTTRRLGASGELLEVGAQLVAPIGERPGGLRRRRARRWEAVGGAGETISL